MSLLLNLSNKKNHLVGMFLVSLILRSCMFFFFVQHTSEKHARYYQADTQDYHNSAFCIATGRGMTMPNKKPIFWRTPGYPMYLAPFYWYSNIKTGAFNDYQSAQKTAIWLQIIVCSLAPIIIFYLALGLTNIYAMALMAGWVSVFHIGLILASTYLLTDGIAVLFFTFFSSIFLKLLYILARNGLPYVYALVSCLVYIRGFVPWEKW